VGSWTGMIRREGGVGRLIEAESSHSNYKKTANKNKTTRGNVMPKFAKCPWDAGRYRLRCYAQTYPTPTVADHLPYQAGRHCLGWRDISPSICSRSLGQRVYIETRLLRLPHRHRAGCAF